MKEEGKEMWNNPIDEPKERSRKLIEDIVDERYGNK